MPLSKLSCNYTYTRKNNFMKYNYKKSLTLIILTIHFISLNACGGGSADSNANSDSAINQSSNSISTSTTNNSSEVTYSTGNILCDLSELTFNDDESINANSSYNWSCNTQNRMLTGNGIPNHEVGTFPNSNNPNTISVQTINKTFTNNPVTISSSGAAVVGPVRVIAYALNSVKFDPGTAGTCSSSGSCSLGPPSLGSWSIEALGHSTFDFGDDMNHAHVQPSGEYHYHGVPELYLDKLGKGKTMTLVGWAADGFPVYARYGYTDANDSSSVIKTMKTGWKLKTIADNGRPSTNLRTGATMPLGAFTQDFEYVVDYGDLDQCNGRIGVTPEFPDGIYHYMVTDDFPFFSRCLKGSF
jgi:hypothetical protein